MIVVNNQYQKDAFENVYSWNHFNWIMIFVYIFEFTIHQSLFHCFFTKKSKMPISREKNKKWKEKKKWFFSANLTLKKILHRHHFFSKIFRKKSQKCPWLHWRNRKKEKNQPNFPLFEDIFVELFSFFLKTGFNLIVSFLSFVLLFNFFDNQKQPKNREKKLKGKKKNPLNGSHWFPF